MTSLPKSFTRDKTLSTFEYSNPQAPKRMQYHVAKLFFQGSRVSPPTVASNDAILGITLPRSYFSFLPFFIIYALLPNASLYTMGHRIPPLIVKNSKRESLTRLDIQRRPHWSSTRTSLTVLTASCCTCVRLAPQSTSSTSLPCSVASGSSSASICDRTIALFM